MSILIADIEANGFKPTEIFMIGILDFSTDEYTAYCGDDEVPVGIMRMKEADILVGHFIKGYDIPQIEKLTEGLVKFDRKRVIDTLDLGRRLFPDLKKQRLEDWGEILEFPKLASPIFDRFTPEMLPYCERDVRLNGKVFEFLLNQLCEHRPNEAAEIVRFL